MLSVSFPVSLSRRSVRLLVFPEKNNITNCITVHDISDMIWSCNKGKVNGKVTP